MTKQAETYTEAETEARREAALKVMLATPHKPHVPLRTDRAPKRQRAADRQRGGQQ